MTPFSAAILEEIVQRPGLLNPGRHLPPTRKDLEQLAAALNRITRIVPDQDTAALERKKMAQEDGASGALTTLIVFF
jgi:hypothetical protein